MSVYLAQMLSAAYGNESAKPAMTREEMIDEAVRQTSRYKAGLLWHVIEDATTTGQQYHCSDYSGFIRKIRIHFARISNREATNA